MKLLSLLGVAFASLLSSLSGGLSPKKAVSVNTNFDGTNYFTINLTCNALLNNSYLNDVVSDVNWNTFTNNQYLNLQTLYFWAEDGVEYERHGLSATSNPFALNLVYNSSFASPHKKYFIALDNFIIYKTSTYRKFVAYTRQYFTLDWFENVNFSYGFPNYGGYADSVCEVMRDYALNDVSVTTWKQGFLSLTDVYQPSYLITDVYDDEFGFIIDGDFYFGDLLDASSNGSMSCPFSTFNGRNYNFITSNGLYMNRLPYGYFLSYDSYYENVNFDDWYDSFDETWTFNFYGVTADSQSYSQGFSDGYYQGEHDGYVKGAEVGYQEGLDEGYAHGYNVGYNVGYTDGHNTTDYSFMDLFGAIADTPVLMIRSLFNFDVFGMNLLTVVMSLFTALILFYLLRKLF